MAGNQAANDTGFKMLRKAGTYVMFGLPPQPVTLDISNYIIFKGATVIGINGRKMFETWYEMSGLLNSGLVDPSPVITHRFPFQDFLKSFELATSTTTPSAKVVLMM